MTFHDRLIVMVGVYPRARTRLERGAPLGIDRASNAIGNLPGCEGGKNRRGLAHQPRGAFRNVAHDDRSPRGKSLGRSSSEMRKRHLIEHDVGGL